MVADGAMAEVEALLALALDPALPAMKAIGVRELAMVIEGRATMAQAQKLASIATRQYAKRQSTWFRHQLGPQWQRMASRFCLIFQRLAQCMSAICGSPLSALR